MTFIEDMTVARDLILTELEWFEGEDWATLSASERRHILANHLCMTLDTGSVDLTTAKAMPARTSQDVRP